MPTDCFKQKQRRQHTRRLRPASSALDEQKHVGDVVRHNPSSRPETVSREIIESRKPAHLKLQSPIRARGDSRRTPVEPPISNPQNTASGVLEAACLLSMGERNGNLREARASVSALQSWWSSPAQASVPDSLCHDQPHRHMPPVVVGPRSCVVLRRAHVRRRHDSIRQASWGATARNVASWPPHNFVPSLGATHASLQPPTLETSELRCICPRDQHVPG